MNPETPDKIDIVISASSLDTLQVCPRKYEYRKIRGLGIVGPKDEKLERGDLIHQVLDFYYKGIIAGGITRDKEFVPMGHDGIREAAIDFGRFVALSMDLEIEATEYFLTTARDYIDYAQCYDWEPLFSEAPFSVLFYEDETLRVLFEGKLDLFIRLIRAGIKAWVDHKTQEKQSEPIVLTNQFMGYGFVFKDEVTYGFVNQIGLQKTLSPDRKFKVKTLTFNELSLEEWRENVIYHCKMLERYIRTKFFPMNNVSCRWCEYKDICKEPPNLRERMIEAKYVQMPAHDLFGEKKET